MHVIDIYSLRFGTPGTRLPFAMLHSTDLLMGVKLGRAYLGQEPWVVHPHAVHPPLPGVEEPHVLPINIYCHTGVPSLQHRCCYSQEHAKGNMMSMPPLSGIGTHVFVLIVSWCHSQHSVPSLCQLDGKPAYNIPQASGLGPRGHFR